MCCALLFVRPAGGATRLTLALLFSPTSLSLLRSARSVPSCSVHLPFHVPLPSTDTQRSCLARCSAWAACSSQASTLNPTHPETRCVPLLPSSAKPAPPERQLGSDTGRLGSVRPPAWLGHCFHSRCHSCYSPPIYPRPRVSAGAPCRLEDPGKERVHLRHPQVPLPIPARRPNVPRSDPSSQCLCTALVRSAGRA